MEMMHMEAESLCVKDYEVQVTVIVAGLQMCATERRLSSSNNIVLLWCNGSGQAFSCCFALTGMDVK